MTNQEAIANLNMIRVAFVEPVTKEQRKLIDDTFDNAIKAVKKLDYIDAIIHNTQGIQEDVIRYKMICEVMQND